MTESAQERRVWDLLVQDCSWDARPEHPVGICDSAGVSLSAARVQIFELVVTAILAKMRPEFTWCVTPSGPDQGIDFVGTHRFLDDRELGIEAAITVGGQCKKRTSVGEILSEIAGSLLRMADRINPTLIVVALSAPLSRDRVEAATAILRRQSLRQCHILERAQIEGLMVEHLDVVSEILRRTLSDSEFEDVVAYLDSRAASVLPPAVSVVDRPSRVLAGMPFRVRVEVRWALVSHPDARLRWRPKDDGAVDLIGPIGADVHNGTRITSTTSDSPFVTSLDLEFITFAIGRVLLGDVTVGLDRRDGTGVCTVNLGQLDVVENMRPRFFDLPYQAGLARLHEAFDRVSVGGACTVGVVGAGGSGKSRLCEEFGLEKRRRGCAVITVRHPKTHEEPLRMLGDLLTALCCDEPYEVESASTVLAALAQYDVALARRATPAIHSLFGTRTTRRVDVTDQPVISALLVLLVARSRDQPLIVHLQDLHWCSAEMLGLFDRLLRQLRALSSGGAEAGKILFLFEGRARELRRDGPEAWTSAPFEAFLDRSDGQLIQCSSFSADDGRTFVRRLFEGRHNAHRMLADDLATLQEELADRIYRSAGGNPFHTLEQVRLLKEQAVIGQNPVTGLMYMIRPEPPGTVLPDSVFGAIQLRWEYLRSRADDLALLVWASALLDDRIPMPLFRALWRRLAPRTSMQEVDSTDILWSDSGSAIEVAFRHENYFEAIRRFTVSEEDRLRVVNAYRAWFADLGKPSPMERFGWARTLLELPDPDRDSAKELLLAALKTSTESGDPRLTRRIQAFYLDLMWDIDAQAAIPTAAFLEHCDYERDLCRDLLGLDRDQASRRIERVRERIGAHLRADGGDSEGRIRDALLRRSLAADALYAQHLYNDRRPSDSAAIADHVVRGIRAHRPMSVSQDEWDLLEMEALYTLSCAQAISGDFPAGVATSAAAAAIAERLDCPLSRKILSTYGTILLSQDPLGGEAVLRGCLARWPDDGSSDACLVHVHLSMALILQAYRLANEDSKREALLGEARERMSRVHDICRRLGLYPDAGAAALVRGVASAMSGENEEGAWFAQAVAAAARGRQMEILWRSHINLALALFREAGSTTPTARDHALAALEIMENTLAVYSAPEDSPRFAMLRVGMAAAASLLIGAQDEKGHLLLERYPGLRQHFSDPATGVLMEYAGEPRHYQWLRVGDVDYVLY